MMQVKITTDSTCDLSLDLLKKYDIDSLPLTVILGDRYGKDGIDISAEDIYRYVDTNGRLPKTSASNVGEFIAFFSKFISKGYTVVHFCIGSSFSSSYQNACIAAQELGNVYVVDTANLSAGQGLLVLKGADMAAAGCSAESIHKACTEAIQRVEASFVIDRLDYLYKGGRCSALSALGGNILKVKPCIEVREGKMLPGKKYRGSIERVILRYVDDRLCGRTDIDMHRIFITHTQCPDDYVRHVRERVQELLPDMKEIIETDTGATVAAHCGPNTLGVLFMRKDPN